MGEVFVVIRRFRWLLVAMAVGASLVATSPVNAALVDPSNAWAGDFKAGYSCYFEGNTCSWSFLLRIAGTYQGNAMAGEYKCNGDSYDQMDGPVTCARTKSTIGSPPAGFSGVGMASAEFFVLSMRSSVFGDHELQCKGVYAPFQGGLRASGLCALLGQPLFS